VYADIDLKLNAMAKSIINLKGSYSRWDILNVNVNQSTYEPLQPMEAASTTGQPDTTAEIQAMKTKIRSLEAKLAALQANEN